MAEELILKWLNMMRKETRHFVTQVSLQVLDSFCEHTTKGENGS
jgi:hypothetical protein